MKNFIFRLIGLLLLIVAGITNNPGLFGAGVGLFFWNIILPFKNKNSEYIIKESDVKIVA